MRKTRQLACVLAVVAVLAAGCSRSGDEAESGTSSGGGGTASSSASSSDPTALANGGFGDLEAVCAPGDASGATAQGVTDDEIRIGTLSDKGAQVRPGLTKELYDAAVAFTKWCNDKGGVLGRQLVLDDLDAKLFNYGDAITTACSQDFAIVGGGAVFDDADKDPERGNQSRRQLCGLPSIAGYVVSAEARVAPLQVQPVPNPVYSLPVGRYRAADALVNGGLDGFGILTTQLPAPMLVRDASVEAVELLGGTVVYNQTYNSLGENWAPFIDDMRAKGVKVLELVGEPENLTALQKAMATAGWYPDATVLNTNFYDDKYAAEGGATAKNTYVQTIFLPFDLADENKATADYLEIMRTYNPSGKVAQLGVQATSAYLLFAKAAAACGSNLTRECLLEKAKVTEWSGGGLHAPDNPATGEPSNCFLILRAGTEFTYDEAMTSPNQGRFNCKDDNVLELQRDYGVPRTGN